MSEPVIDPALLNFPACHNEEAVQGEVSHENPKNGRAPPPGAQIATSAIQVQVDYNKLKSSALKQLCKERGMKVGGKKAELVKRLLLHDGAVGSESSIAPVAAPTIDTPLSEDPVSVSMVHTNNTSNPTPPSPPNTESIINVNTAEVLNESESLVEYFDRGLTQRGDNDSESDEEAEVADELNLDEGGDGENMVVDNPKTHAAISWADNFILETRRKGGRQTETSVLNQWKAWVTMALDKGLIPDMIIDSVHIIEYLKYAATRSLFTTHGGKKTSTSRLSASSLKKIMTMLGRVRRRQEDTDPALKTTRPAKNSRTDDFFRALMVQAQRYRLESSDFDITRGTILDSQLRPEQFDEITAAIFLKVKQLPSIIRAHFSWTWQCATLNRSDEVVSMTLASIHPYNLPLPNYTYQDGRISATGREVFGVLAMFHETKTAQPGKTEPTYSFALPHRDPLMCSVGALAILLHFMFDQKDIMGHVPSWDWLDLTTWQSHHIIFGKNVHEPMAGDGLGRMYSSFLDFTSITSGKKTHLARRTMPSKLEEMGVPADQVDATGHWQGNTRREVYSSKIPKAAAVALAGFSVGESYYVPWAQVLVPEALEKQLFPFCEETLAKLRANGCKNQGMMNFLILLQKLRPFFWRAISAINVRFPGSPIIERLNILKSPDSQDFLRRWPLLYDQEESTRHQALLIEQKFQEKPTQNAFAAVVSEIRSLRHTVESSTSQISDIHRRSKVFSPSKPPRFPKATSASSRVEAQTHPAHQDINNSHHILPTTSPSHPAYAWNPPHTEVAPNRPPLPSLQLSSPRNLSRSLGTLSPERDGVNLIITQIGVYRILHLTPSTSPEQPPPHTQHDLILPPCTAFAGSLYPRFTTHNCTWQHILDAVVHPVELWTTYEPGSLGEYSDVKSLWQAWDEGTFIPNVGHKPALRLIDSRWGDLKNQSTNKKKFPAWRPRNNDNARTKWSRFHFFIKAINDRVSDGHSTDAAVLHFDSLRGDNSVHGLFKQLKPKKQTAAATGIQAAIDMLPTVPTSPSTSILDAQHNHVPPQLPAESGTRGSKKRKCVI